MNEALIMECPSSLHFLTQFATATAGTRLIHVAESRAPHSRLYRTSRYGPPSLNIIFNTLFVFWLISSVSETRRV